MRSHYTREILQNPYKVSPFQQRSRLKSLKQLRQIPYEDTVLQNKSMHDNILKILQKKLVQDNAKQQQTQQQQTLTNSLHRLNKSKSQSQSKHTKRQQSQNKLLSLRQNNKLFQFFQQQYKKQIPSDKVQRQKVNYWQKQFNLIKLKVNHKLEINKMKIQEIQKKVTQNYVDLHEYSVELKELHNKLKEEQKAIVLNQKKRKSKPTHQSLTNSLDINNNQITIPPQQSSNLSTFKLKPPSIKQKHQVIQQTISQLKKQTTHLQQQIQTIKSKDQQIQQEWIMFLKLFINTGYYLSNGQDSVIEELKRLNVKLSQDDLLSGLMDQNAKRYFLKYYQGYEGKKKSADSNVNYVNFGDGFEKRTMYERNKIYSNIQMKNLANQVNLKNIYSNTRQAMTVLLKKSSFRASPEIDKAQKRQPLFPKIQDRLKLSNSKNNKTTDKKNEAEFFKKSKTLPLDNASEKQRQISRINHIYLGTGDEEMETKGKLLKRILFGFGAK